MGHIHEKMDFTASIFIVHEGKVLLHRHKTLGIWLQPGGHIELDEDPNEAAVREAKEETGLAIELVGEKPDEFHTKYSVRQLIAPRFMNRHFIGEGQTHEHIDMVYFAKSKNAELRPEEGSGEVRWFTRKELSDPSFDLLPDVRFYAETALKELAS